MKHLITGGSGFLGSLVAKRLLQNGEHVRVFDRQDDPDRDSEIEFVQGDILDCNLLAKSMRGIDVVHHTAALVPLTRSKDDFFLVNFQGSQIVAQEACRAAVKMVINTSSSAIFGKPLCPVQASTEPKPVESYGQSKLDGEQVMARVLDQHSIPFISVRPRTIVSEGRLGIFQILFDWIQDGRKVYVIGDGNAHIQFLHSSDLIDAYILLLGAAKPGYYNVGTDRFGTIREALERLIAHAGTNSKVTPIPYWLATNALRLLYTLRLSPLVPWHYLTYGSDFFFDIEPLKQLGWQPAYSNDEMIAESYDYFVSHYRSIMDSKLTASVHRSPVQQKLLGLVKMMS